MENSNGEEQGTCDQKAPEAISEAGEDVGEPGCDSQASEDSRHGSVHRVTVDAVVDGHGADHAQEVGEDDVVVEFHDYLG